MIDRTRRCSERKPAGSFRDKYNAIGGWLPSLIFALGKKMLARSIEIEARSRIMWGDSPASVMAFLQENGVGDKDASSLVATFQKERAKSIRESAVKKVLVGLLYLCVPAGAFVMFTISGDITAKFVALAFIAGLIGSWKVVDGVWMLLRPLSSGEDLATIEE